MTEPRTALLKALAGKRAEHECEMLIEFASTGLPRVLPPGLYVSASAGQAPGWEDNLRAAAQSVHVAFIEPNADRITFLESKVDDLSRRLDALSHRIEQAPLLQERPAASEIDSFNALVSEWKVQRGHCSRIREMAMLPAYQQIIAMGPKVVPLLLREMEMRPSQWTWALRMLTRANPVGDEIRGKLGEMAKAWVQWGKNNGYCW